MYTTQAAAIENYWFDVDGTTFPAGFGHSTVGMVWGDGGAYATWFSAEPEKIQGINQLPITGGHLYLGLQPRLQQDQLRRNRPQHGWQPRAWQDIIWEFLAMGTRISPLAISGQPGLHPRGGRVQGPHLPLDPQSGRARDVDATVTANHPLARAFLKDGQRTYVAANITSTPLTVTFSNGTARGAGRQDGRDRCGTWSGGNAANRARSRRPSRHRVRRPVPARPPTPSPTPTRRPGRPDAHAHTDSHCHPATGGGSRSATSCSPAACGRHRRPPGRSLDGGEGQSGGIRTKRGLRGLRAEPHRPGGATTSKSFGRLGHAGRERDPDPPLVRPDRRRQFGTGWRRTGTSPPTRSRARSATPRGPSCSGRRARSVTSAAAWSRLRSGAPSATSRAPWESAHSPGMDLPLK